MYLHVNFLWNVQILPHILTTLNCPLIFLSQHTSYTLAALTLQVKKSPIFLTFWCFIGSCLKWQITKIKENAPLVFGFLNAGRKFTVLAEKNACSQNTGESFSESFSDFGHTNLLSSLLLNTCRTATSKCIYMYVHNSPEKEKKIKKNFNCFLWSFPVVHKVLPRKKKH